MAVHFENVYHLLQPSQRLDSQTLVSLLQTSLFFTFDDFDGDEIIGATWRLKFYAIHNKSLQKKSGQPPQVKKKIQSSYRA